MKLLVKILLVPVLALFCASIAIASPVSWADWDYTVTNAIVDGELTVGTSTVDVWYSGPYVKAQTGAASDINYWTYPTTYTSAEVDNAPPPSDIIELNTGGSKSINFSQAVTDPLLALVSWNGNTVEFGVPIEILSYGQGYWGNGTPTLNAAGTGFYGSGEVHGVIRLPGTYTSISFTDTTENWHGFTVGVSGVSGEVPIPEPATMLLFGTGLIGLAGLGRKRFIKK